MQNLAESHRPLVTASPITSTFASCTRGFLNQPNLHRSRVDQRLGRYILKLVAFFSDLPPASFEKTIPSAPTCPTGSSAQACVEHFRRALLRVRSAGAVGGQ